MDKWKYLDGPGEWIRILIMEYFVIRWVDPQGFLELEQAQSKIAETCDLIAELKELKYH